MIDHAFDRYDIWKTNPPEPRRYHDDCRPVTRTTLYSLSQNGEFPKPWIHSAACLELGSGYPKLRTYGSSIHCTTGHLTLTRKHAADILLQWRRLAAKPRMFGGRVESQYAIEMVRSPAGGGVSLRNLGSSPADYCGR